MVKFQIYNERFFLGKSFGGAYGCHGEQSKDEQQMCGEFTDKLRTDRGKVCRK